MSVLTERLELTPITAGDAEELLALFRDEEVRRYLADGKRVERAFVEGLIRDSERDFGTRRLGLFAVRERGAQPVIGLTGFRDFHEPPVFELIYALLPGAWQRGFAVEMGRAMLETGFTMGGLERIHASTDAPNEASIRVMRRLRMRLRARDAARPSDQIHYCIERSDWLTGPAQ